MKTYFEHQKLNIEGIFLMQSWESFWGRPGYGAPREGKMPHKENLMKILYYPDQEKV